MQVNFSVVTPRYSPDLIKLYEKINQSNGEFKIEKVGGLNFCVLLHKSIQLIEENEIQLQQQKQQQQQLQFQQQPTPQNVYINPLSNKTIEVYFYAFFMTLLRYLKTSNYFMLIRPN